MFIPKRIIPSLTAGAISLAGCANVSGDGGGGDGGDGGTGGVGGTQEDIRAFCMKIVDCDPINYSYDYCVTNISALEPNLSAQCRAVVLSYFACVEERPCQTFRIDCYSPELNLCLSTVL
ncbi:MAG: hypothetical protein AAF997_18440 [Myxococcota bacterium]